MRRRERKPVLASSPITIGKPGPPVTDPGNKICVQQSQRPSPGVAILRQKSFFLVLLTKLSAAADSYK
jgi:hypothetical protein